MMDLLNCYSIQLKPRFQVPSSLVGCGFFNLNTFMMEKETWKDIEGYEGLYQVSNRGRVKSLNYGRESRAQVLKPSPHQAGYEFADLWKSGKRKMCTIHRLVAKAFIPNPKNKRTVNHKNGIKDDNRVENLEWATYVENNRHAFRTGLYNVSPLSEKQVLKIRKTAKKRGYRYRRKELAETYDVTEETIKNIVNRKTWIHL